MSAARWLSKEEAHETQTSTKIETVRDTISSLCNTFFRASALDAPPRSALSVHSGVMTSGGGGSVASLARRTLRNVLEEPTSAGCHLERRVVAAAVVLTSRTTMRRRMCLRFVFP